MPAGDDLGGAPAGSPAPEGGAAPIKIPAESLPPGIKAGDCLRCTGMDDSGCTFTLEAGEGDAGKGDSGTAWEDDFRQAMSPTNPQEGAA